jgi:hypothetical protein
MSQLVYSEAELLQEHDYAAPHVAAGYRLHGGLDDQGRYVSPRSRVRPAAVRAWQEQLRSEGHDLLEADPSLFTAGSYPGLEQTRLMLRRGIDQGLWNSLTITGVIEARGKYLCGFRAPDFRPLVEEDLSVRALGHLNQGLLQAHGLDEGGDPQRGLGGHDAMWFAIRDLALGKNRHPLPEVPPSIGRPEAGRLAPQLPAGHEQLVLLLMNVLLIEVRAEILFSFVEHLLSDPELFRAPRSAVDEALTLVGRIRQDEEVHVEYLRTVLSELRALTFRARGERLPGAAFLDPIWKDLIHWHAVENPRRARPQQRNLVRTRILAQPDGESIWREFTALDAPDLFDDPEAPTAS